MATPSPTIVPLRWYYAAPAWIRAELIATSWEIFSVLLFASAVAPQALDRWQPGTLFLAGLVFSIAIVRRLAAWGRRGLLVAGGLRIAVWVLAIVPLVSFDLGILFAAAGFGLMAGTIRRAVYRRHFEPPDDDPAPVRMRAELRTQLGENAAVAGILGGHVMLLFGVAFLQTDSKDVVRAWWDIIPALAILGTAGFTVAVRPTTSKVMHALRQGQQGDAAALEDGLDQALRVPTRLALINFGLWLICTSIGVFYFRPGPDTWHPADAVLQLMFGTLFSWGVSFYQRGFHEDSMRPVVARLRQWTGRAAEAEAVDIRQRMLRVFGLPSLFALSLSLLASIGSYRTLTRDLSWQEDFNSITALNASFVMLVLALASAFVRAARQLSMPLERLADASNQVASGKLDAEVPVVQGPTEVVALGRSIEDMRRTLAQTIADLEEERSNLEANVAERTAELQTALDELKQAQTALIQGERLALIGELVANVAHEIHNPLNAIVGSISSLERIRDELSSMLAAYAAAEAALPEAERAALRKKRAELDIDGALDDLAGVLRVVQNATRRSVDIVANLRSFSRAADEAVPSDLRLGLQETLTLLQHSLDKNGITVEEDYQALPLVPCRTGEINQVFMNLLTNAIAAVGEDGAIRLEARVQGDQAVVQVSDSGPGVPQAMRKRIFEPFVTTKPRGEGTGLGLSISAEIVRRHSGSLQVDDGPLGGARFTLKLPLTPG